MALTLVNSAVIILLVYVHIDTGDPTFGHYSHDKCNGERGEGGGGGGGGLGGEAGGEGGREGEGGGAGERENQRIVGTDVEIMRVLRKLQAAQVYYHL